MFCATSTGEWMWTEFFSVREFLLLLFECEFIPVWKISNLTFPYPATNFIKFRNWKKMNFWKFNSFFIHFYSYWIKISLLYEIISYKFSLSLQWKRRKLWKKKYKNDKYLKPPIKPWENCMVTAVVKFECQKMIS